MKTLIINGSLKGEASHSYMVASRFARGIEATADAQTEVIELKNMNVKTLVLLKTYAKEDVRVFANHLKEMVFVN